MQKLTVFVIATVMSSVNAFAISAADIYKREAQIFAEYPVQQEVNPNDTMNGVAKTASIVGYQSILKYVDPKGQFQRFFTVSGNTIVAYKDRDSKQVTDFSFTTATKPVGLNLPIPKAGQPLAGLRVALDPGHMGGSYWDKETGKYASDGAGHTISEGVINLQTSLIVKSELEALGATVMITRTGLRPVSNLQMSQINMIDFGHQELRSQSLEDWFLSLMNLSTFSETESGVRSKMSTLDGEGRRSTYFIEREDLDARVRLIAAFKPDLTIIIHYDSPDSAGKYSGHSVLTGGSDITRVYIPGSFQADEFATPDLRAEIAAILLSPNRFHESAKMSAAISGHIASELGVKLASGEDGTVTIQPGVLTRNLRVSRKITSGLVTYAECLMYGNSSEFQKLLAKDYSMPIDGQNYYYSQRLKDVAFAIRDGVVSYYQAQ